MSKDSITFIALDTHKDICEVLTLDIDYSAQANSFGRVPMSLIPSKLLHLRLYSSLEKINVKNAGWINFKSLRNFYLHISINPYVTPAK